MLQELQLRKTYERSGAPRPVVMAIIGGVHRTRRRRSDKSRVREEHAYLSLSKPEQRTKTLARQKLKRDDS